MDGVAFFLSFLWDVLEEVVCGVLEELALGALEEVVALEEVIVLEELGSGILTELISGAWGDFALGDSGVFSSLLFVLF